MTDRNEVFAEKVRAAYLEVYGEDSLQGLDDGEPFTLGTVVVGMEANHLDGEHSSIHVYSGSTMAALGLLMRGQATLNDGD